MEPDTFALEAQAAQAGEPWPTPSLDDAVNQMFAAAAGEIDEAGIAQWFSTRLVRDT